MSLLGQSNPSNAAHLVRCRILSYDLDSGIFKVIPIENPNQQHVRGFNARMISNLPQDPKGGGVRAIPTSPENTFCWCIRINSMFYILGFYTEHTTTVHGNTFDRTPLEPGDTLFGHDTGTYLKINKQGVMSFFTNIFSQIHLDPIAQTLLANIKNIVLTVYGGFVKWTHNISEGTTALFGEIHKNFDVSLTRLTLPTERIKFKFGTIEEDTHIAEIDVQQEPTAQEVYNVEENIKHGVQTDRKMFSWKLKDIKALQTYTMDLDLNGVINWENLQETAQHNMKVKLDTKGDQAVAITVNDRYGKKVTMSILQTGETLYDVNDGTMNIKIEPTGDVTYFTKGKESVHITKTLTELVDEDVTTTYKQNEIKTVEQDQTLTVKGNRITSIEADEKNTLKGNQTNEVTDGNVVTTINHDLTMNADNETRNISKSLEINSKDETHNASDSFDINTKDVTVNASDSHTINTSEESINADSLSVTVSGNVKIKGTGITIDGSSVIIKGSTVSVTGGALTVKGSAPGSTGPFNMLPVCMFTGAPHGGTTVTGT